MRWILAAALWCLVAGFAAGEAVAAARLQAMRVDGIGILTVGNVGRAPTVVTAGRGQLVIETHARLPADAANRLNALRSVITGVTVAGSRLRLALAPGIATTSQPHESGDLSVTFERVGTTVVEPSPPAASATVASRARTIPLPAPRPGTDQPIHGVHEPAPPVESAMPDRAQLAGSPAHGGAELDFAWPTPVRAAIFQRAGVLWAAFDAAPGAVAEVGDLRDPSLAAWLEPLPPVTAGHAQLFRFQLRRKLRVEAVQEGATWRVPLSPEGSHDSVAAPVGVSRDTGRGLLHGPPSVRALDFEDPETGERLGALLAAGGSLRQPAAVRLVDLELLPAAQGLAWQPLADGITVTAGEDGFTLTREGGLRLSGGDEEVPAAPPHTPAAAHPAPPVASAAPSPPCRRHFSACRRSPAPIAPAATRRGSSSPVGWPGWSRCPGRWPASTKRGCCSPMGSARKPGPPSTARCRMIYRPWRRARLSAAGPPWPAPRQRSRASPTRPSSACAGPSWTTTPRWRCGERLQPPGPGGTSRPGRNGNEAVRCSPTTRCRCA